MDKQEAWQQVAEQVGGQIKGGETWWKADTRVEVSIPFEDDSDAAPGAWTVTLDNYTTVVPAGKVFIPIVFARAYAPFVTSDNLRLTICRANFFTPVAAFFGAQDVEIGDTQFDRQFVVKTSDPEQALRLLNGEPGQRLRECIAAIPDIHLSVVDEDGTTGAGGRLASGVDLIHLYTASAQLPRDARALRDVTAEMLRGLARIGSAEQRGSSVAESH